MPETDGATELIAGLLRDMGGAVARSGRPESESDGLMRVMDDPLAVAALVARRETPETDAPKSPTISSISLWPTRKAGEMARARSPYRELESLASPSIRPEAFIARADDRGDAINDEDAFRRTPTVPLAAGAIGMVFILLIYLLARS